MTKLEKSEPFYQISQVSKLLGITSDRLRTYEEEGLIKPYRTKDSSNGKRLYSQDEVEWLEIIRELIKIGVTIPAIRVFLSCKNFSSTNFLQEKDVQIINLIKKLQNHTIYEKVVF